MKATQTGEYRIRHAARGCYEVCRITPEGRMGYLTNFKSKRDAKRFVDDHRAGLVTVDPETCIPSNEIWHLQTVKRVGGLE
tara:strand:- start:165 stop:407 length:243 start_codon:yes stop_codon:yes gene_type:complete